MTKMTEDIAAVWEMFRGMFGRSDSAAAAPPELLPQDAALALKNELKQEIEKVKWAKLVGAKLKSNRGHFAVES